MVEEVLSLAFSNAAAGSVCFSYVYLLHIFNKSLVPPVDD